MHDRGMKTNAFALKVAFTVLCLVMLALQLRSMSGWNEQRAVYDDICYLRQAHLFQRFGLAGFDTDIVRDDDGYFRSKLKEIGFSDWKDATVLPCHNPMPVTGKVVIQYPPGTGMVLAGFPAGHQVVPMFWLSTIAVFGVALLAIFRGRTTASIVAAGLFGCFALYIMINPIKASYSMAPTAVVCALAGCLTARWLTDARPDARVGLVVALGFVLGLGVNFRLANFLLAGGCGFYLLGAFLRSRTVARFLQGLLFAISYVAGAAPTITSYWVNTGSPFTSTYYGSADAQSFDLSFSAVWTYLGDYLQAALLALAIAITLLLVFRGGGVRRVATLTGINLLLNLGFFLTHSIATPYYTIAISLLSLWSLVFAVALQEARSQPFGASAGTISAVPR